MNAICNRVRGGFIGLLAGLVMSGVVFAQQGAISSLNSLNSPQASGSSATLAAFQQEHLALAQEWETLVASGATQQQLLAWRQQNAAQIQAQQQQAQAFSIATALKPVPMIGLVDVPANASDTLKDFLTARAALANARAQIHNQLLQAMPANAAQTTQDQVTAMQRQEAQTFQQQSAGDLRLQSLRAQALAAQAASRPLPVPAPVIVPPNATPLLKAHLAARDALAQGWARVWNQYLTADPATREAALEQWRQQNAGPLLQLREQAQALANSTSTQQGTNQ